MSSHDPHSPCCGGGSCASDQENQSHNGHSKPSSCCGESRRDFLFMTAGAMAAVGAGSVVWPFVHQMNPAADTLAMSTTEVDLSSVEVGQSVTVMWRGKPVFIRRRTVKEIQEAADVDVSTLRDKQADADRVKAPEWLIVIGVCTHLGCVPLGQKTGDMRGDYDGWFCPCHGSAYDSSGRIRKGPAPKNLEVPTYSFLSDTLVRIG
ncbi:MAG: ubiquinol-cytochrome c reductase iron-sulfur subunit [Alphaproteobacteria bacterium]|nr:ubiquinol-cytochrome c reductase iron-sulfur subunit [Alphaproteobacteria bacterium]MCB9985286.1 ubiquinol-cytochrome c reductase iron-sulfur subunit [Micavibrio sp.]HPQ50171.1 ubiquinol-cytochrome c reductase iron-sulfur subunit [Alphaproteobacteria bacterium]